MMHEPQKPGGSPEQAVIERAIRGDSTAFGELYDHYVGPIYTFIFFQVSDVHDAEDLTETVFLKAFENLPGFRRGRKMENFRAWIYRIARNLVIDFYRTRKPLAPLEVDSPLLTEKTTPESLTQAAEAESEMRAALDSLDDLFKQVIVMRFFSGLSYPETAQALGITENYVRVIQHRALRKMRAWLDEADLE